MLTWYVVISMKLYHTIVFVVKHHKVTNFLKFDFCLVFTVQVHESKMYVTNDI